MSDSGAYRKLIDEAVIRVGRHGVADWLEAAAARLGAPLGRALSAAPRQYLDFADARRQIAIRLNYPFWESVRVADRQAWILYELKLDASNVALPFGLDARTETPESAKRKLSTDTVKGRREDFDRGDFEVTHFLPDGLIVVVEFRRDLVGIASLTISRLGVSSDFRTLGRSDLLP
ncbi:MAG: hypothetical protein ACLPGW_06040 [Roseiarcus sp.]